MNNDRSKFDIPVLLAVSAILILWRLGSGSLTSWDEALYGAISRGILDTGNWIDLRWAGNPWVDKPPLYMWVTVLFYKLFGVNEFAVRLFSALSGIGTVLATYLLGRKLYSRQAGIASALAILTSFSFFWGARVGMLDVTLTFFTVLSLLFFKLGEEKKLFLFFAPVAFAAAFMTKSMAAAPIPVILGIYIIATGQLKVFKERSFIAGILTALLIIASWHIAAFAHYGGNFFNDYFVRNTITRSSTSMEGHTGDILTYFGVIPNKGRPWALFGFALLPLAAALIFAKKEKQHILPVIWASAAFVIISAVKTKLHWYVMPIYPALALLTGWALSSILKKYTVPVVSLLAACSMIYLAADKHVFNLDYSPQVKATAEAARAAARPDEKIYIYDIIDPGIQFYLADVCQNVRGEEPLKAALSGKDHTILTVRGKIPAISGPGREIVYENGDFVMFKVTSDK
jgi:4-amino-4-deoxy-L-arabinose transferase-like glycosyltransferase